MAVGIVAPLVTIITPAYNRAAYLEETIQSVLTQDYPHIEYIVLDDGSTDHTRQVLESYTGRLFWESHPNMGETRTVNKGWRMARGEIIAVVNSDDPLLPGAVRAAVEFMNARPDILVAYPDWDKIGPRGEVLSRVQVPEYDYVYMLTCHHCIVGPGAFIRRKALDLAGFRDEEFRYVADFEYWLRLGLHGSFARIPKALATFRVHPDSASASHTGRRMAAEHIRLVQKFYALPNLPPEIWQARAAAYSWAHYVASEMCGRDVWLARWHFLRSVLYRPGLYWGAYAYKWAHAVPLVSPRLARVVRAGWRLTRPFMVRMNALLTSRR